MNYNNCYNKNNIRMHRMNIKQLYGSINNILLPYTNNLDRQVCRLIISRQQTQSEGKLL